MAARELAITALLVSVISPGLLPGATFSDDFEDGIIASDLWVYGGTRRGYPSDPFGGDWSYSHTEENGQLRSRVWGPDSGLTFGAEAWVMTVNNYNDGQAHLINFNWQPQFNDPHYNSYFIQITDGFISDTGTPSAPTLHWNHADWAGTANLLTTTNLGTEEHGWGFENTSSPGELEWSIVIDATGIASLFEGRDGQGVLRNQEALDPAYDWHLRFMVVDGTSSGFPAGDASLILNSFSSESSSVPEPASLILWSGLGAMGLIAARRKRKAC